MSRNTRRLAAASLAFGLGLGLGGTVAAQADDGPETPDFFGTDVGDVFADDLPVITGDIEGGLGSLLSGDSGLLGGILGGTGGLLDGLLGGLGLVNDPELSIQPVPPLEGPALEHPKVAGGVLDNLLGIGSLTESLAGRL